MIADHFGVTFPDEQRSSQRRTHVTLCDLPNLEGVLETWDRSIMSLDLN